MGKHAADSLEGPRNFFTTLQFKKGDGASRTENQQTQ